MDEQYKKSIDLWIKEQEKTIALLILNAEYLDKEIRLKNELLQNTIESIEHEKQHLQSYIDKIL